MLNATQQLNSIPQFPISKTLIFPNQINRTQIFFLPPKPTIIGFPPHLPQIRTGFRISAAKSRAKSVNGFLDLEAEADEFHDDNDNGGDEDEDEVIIPLKNMKEWVENKPRGFGEGKEYDTSVEDKLLEEMLQSREAQLANINKLKNSPGNNIKSEPKNQQVNDKVPSRYRVRLTNLPKKKNIHRDLQSAFKGVAGIVNITPAVAGSKKTRDPICRGFAVVDFKSEDAANRFLEIFSRQTILFGKIQKQIKCEKMNWDVSKPAAKHLVDENNGVLELEIPNPGIEIDSQPELDNESGKVEAIAMVDSLSSKKKEISRVKGKKAQPKGKKERVPKLSMGSANRLKIREKAVLSGVFAKYAVNAGLATK